MALAVQRCMLEHTCMLCLLPAPHTQASSGEPDLQIRFVPGFALDPDAIQSYVKVRVGATQ
jgi:hypothetical protein